MFSLRLEALLNWDEAERPHAPQNRKCNAHRPGPLTDASGSCLKFGFVP